MVGRAHAPTTLTVVLFVVATTALACGERTVKISWDAPSVKPDGYRILVDDQLVMDFPVPPTDPRCSCMNATVPVPSGRHVVKVIAYNQFGQSPSATIVVP